jgi:NitT/TauT family transport system substrate-binding protein
MKSSVDVIARFIPADDKCAMHVSGARMQQLGFDVRGRVGCEEEGLKVDQHATYGRSCSSRSPLDCASSAGRVRSGNDRSAVAGGAIDIAPSNTLAIASAHARGLPIAILVPAALYTTARTTHALVVGKDSDVRNARDLAGKTVSIVGLRSLEELAVRSWIDANGGDSRKTAFIELPNAAQVPALLAHHIDGAMMPEPWITNAKNDTRMLCKPMDSIADHFVVTAWFTTQSWLDQNRDAAKRFVAAMQRTAAWANTNPSASGAILAKSLRLPVATVDAMVRMTMGETLNADLFQPVIDTGVKYGFFDKSFPAREMLALDLSPSVPTAVIGLTFGGITADDTGYAIKH